MIGEARDYLDIRISSKKGGTAMTTLKCLAPLSCLISVLTLSCVILSCPAILPCPCPVSLLSLSILVLYGITLLSHHILSWYWLEYLRWGHFPTLYEMKRQYVKHDEFWSKSRFRQNKWKLRFSWASTQKTHFYVELVVENIPLKSCFHQNEQK